MALANRKSEDIFNKNTGGSKDAKSITDSKELEIKSKFDNGDHILDEGMFENLAPALYAVQQVAEDIEEIRRFIVSEITSITTSQANAITANTAKTTFPGFGTSSTTALAGDTTTISTSQASAITANTAKRDATNIYVPLVCNMLNADCTTAQFVPFSDGITEGTSSTNPRNVFVAPANGTIKSIHAVSQNSLLDKGKGVPLVATFAKRTNGSSSLAPCATVTMTTVAANTVMSGDFVASAKGGTLAFSKGEQILVSLQLTNSVPTGSKNYYVTVIFQLDQTNLD
jgi:hypothetical protein